MRLLGQVYISIRTVADIWSKKMRSKIVWCIVKSPLVFILYNLFSQLLEKLELLIAKSQSLLEAMYG